MDKIDTKALQREIFLAFWKVHILHHAAENPVVGHWILQELRRHGYDISPGTMYPILHRMERLGWLLSGPRAGRRSKAGRPYRLTKAGLAVLSAVKRQLKELTDELNHG